MGEGISRTKWNDNGFVAFAIAVTSFAAYAFYGPAMRACHGDFPVPLDDVYIHFDFARSACRGHPFAWIAGQGFSSGETSPLYALVLAAGYAIGFRGGALAWFSAGVACASIVSAMRSMRALVPSFASACAGAAFLVAIGALDFALFSGMEVALFVALVFRAFVLVDRVVRAPPHLRASRQLRLGALGTLLVWTRPEAVVVVAVLAVLAARHARSQSPLAAMTRVAAPGALATLAIAALNFAMTGDWASAGARLKLLSSNPYLSDLDRARELVLNAFYFSWKVLAGSVVADARISWLVAACVVAAIASGRTRAVASAVATSGLLFALLVSFNGAARYQGFRYYAPSVAMLVLAVAMGLGAVARRTHALVGLVLGASLALSAASRAGAQARFFGDASRNIHDQQTRVGRRLHELVPEDARVLLGDAGAIPYFSDRGAIDALGLGGYRRMPFTRAALSGEASTLELLQTLPKDERPAWIALYPNWFPAITSRFAREVERVTIDHNVICGGPTKLIARADWSLLDGDVAPSDVLDELDVADVESERAHDYVSPAPNGGYAIVGFGDGVFDGGRIVPEGEREEFTARASSERASLVVRSDRAIDVVIAIGGVSRAASAPAIPNAWTAVKSGPFAIVAGDRVALRARGPLRDFHVWITR